jgi:hypothetical protein
VRVSASSKPFDISDTFDLVIDFDLAARNAHFAMRSGHQNDVSRHCERTAQLSRRFVGAQTSASTFLGIGCRERSAPQDHSIAPNSRNRMAG